MQLSNGIPYGRHNIIEGDIQSVAEVLRGDWLTTGPYVKAFELALESYVSAPSISVSSGTAALHTAYAAIDLESGDEIITPPLTFIATQATAAQLGATIKFADIQEDTGNIDPLKVEEQITSNTKAIVAVDYAGHPADLDELSAIAKKYGLYLIEDAAHSLGSLYKGKSVGSISDLTTFSFFPTKNLTTGEGGAVSSTSPELLRKAERFSKQGLVREPDEFLLGNVGPWHQEVHKFGLNYRLPDILCALGISQLARLEFFKSERVRIFNKYSEILAGIPEVRCPSKRDYVDPNWHLYPIRVPSPERLNLFKHLRADGFLVQVNYLPAHLHPVFSNNFAKGDYPLSEKYYEEEISLPIFVNPGIFNDAYFEKIEASIGNYFKTKAR